MIKPKNKLFIVKKYIMAKSAKDAILKDKKTPVDDVWIDEEWKKGNHKELQSAIGFNHYEDSSSLDWDNVLKK